MDQIDAQDIIDSLASDLRDAHLKMAVKDAQIKGLQRALAQAQADLAAASEPTEVGPEE